MALGTLSTLYKLVLWVFPSGDERTLVDVTTAPAASSSRRALWTVLDENRHSRARRATLGQAERERRQARRESTE